MKSLCLVLFLGIYHFSLGQLKTNEIAPMQDVEMKSVDGPLCSLSSLKKDKGLIVVFSCNSCPFVVGSDDFPGWEKQYASLYNEALANNIGFVLVNSNEGKRAQADSYEEMIKHDSSLGGEQSGHIILSDYNTTGDGLMAALEVLSVLVESKEPASKTYHLYTNMPQVMKNIRWNLSNPLEDTNIKMLINTVIQENKDKVRILVRKSGTENLIRVMAEGQNKKEIESIVDYIISKISEYSSSL